jgi:hypothetical protein
MAETSRRGTTSEDGAGDFFGLLTRWRRLAQGGTNVLISNHSGICGAPLRATLMAIPETSPEYGVVRRVWRSPRTRERRAERRVGGPRARERDVQRWMRLGPRAFG